MNLTTPTLVLASKSRSRSALLGHAGLSFEIEPADIDERSVEAPLVKSDFSALDIAEVLAEAKARDVAERHEGAFVIGADQTLELEGERLNKPEDMEAARRQLLSMRGRCHHLHAAIVICRDDTVLWRHVSTARLKMRDFSNEFLGRYLAQVGDRALLSVGAYQLEGPGIQLFDEIDGDFFTILGLPMLPLLAFLRDQGAIDR